MPVFTRVEVRWSPAQNAPAPGDPEEEAFDRSARSVTELYSEALAALRVPGYRSLLCIFCHHDPSAKQAAVRVVTDRNDGFEMAVVALPTGVAELHPQERALLVLDVVHGAVLRLAEARDMDASQFEQARQHVLDSDLEYRWDGPWKASPDRRHRARARYRLLHHGYGRARIEVQRREDEFTVAVSGEALAYRSSEGFKRSARTLRWDGSAAVHLIPYSGGATYDQHGLVRLELSEGAWRSFTDDGMNNGAPWAATDKAPVSERPRPAVVVRGDGADAAEAPPRIRVIGGGPMNGVPDGYSRTLKALLAAFGSPPGQQWWSAAGIKELEVSYWFNVDAARVRSWRRKNRLSAVIERPTPTMKAGPERLAMEDVASLVAEVRRRTGLGPHPAVQG